VSDATGDGILSVADHSTIVNNRAFHNEWTGIDLNGSSWSLVAGNVTNRNTGGGITLANDAGAFIPGATASHDRVLNNVAANNPKGCGIIVVDHLGSTVEGAQGVFDNLIRGNVLKRNGTVGFGAGIVIASPVPGGAVYDNVVLYNTIRGSGLAGVTIHSHMSGQNLSGNVIVRNTIGTNNLAGDYADSETTGVYVGSVDPLTVTVRRNLVHDDHYGIFTAGSIAVNGAYHNAFVRIAESVGGTSSYSG
jgi:parallel beta-helix repeat protein